MICYGLHSPEDDVLIRNSKYASSSPMSITCGIKQWTVCTHRTGQGFIVKFAISSCSTNDRPNRVTIDELREDSAHS